MYIISIPLLIIFLIVAIANWVLAIKWYLFKKQSTLIPLIGGISGAIGVAIFPLSYVSKWWWIPLIVDIGSGVMMAGLIYTLVKTNIDKKD